ncbi:MAG: FCD domain-containing protein [Alphaproteobacteria bacterium]|nr:FCD domain-containing protein [Alphaproteobacteria bacterium]
MNDTIAPIERQSLHDTVTERIRDMIVEGTYQPGSRLPERVLCETLGISRTPLREALKVLASEGLLEIAPNRGARVAGLTAEDVDELFPVMGALEALSGELACARITETELAEIRALHYQMVLHHTRGERPPYFEINQQIHEKILEAARNPTLAVAYNNLSGRIRRARYTANISATRWAQAVSEHEEMLEALAERDGPRLAGILKRHLHNKCETVKAALAAAE